MFVSDPTAESPFKMPANSRPSRNSRRFAFRWEAHTNYSLRVRVYESSPIYHMYLLYVVIVLLVSTALLVTSDISRYACFDLDNPVIHVGKDSK